MSGSILDQIANPKQVNLLGAYQGANDVARGIWANRQSQANQLAGEAFQNSVNPDGTPNQARLNQNIVAAGPQAALAAQQASQRGQDLDTSTFDTHMKRLTGVNAAAMALTAQYPNGVPQKAVYDEIDRVGPTYGLTQQEMAQAKASFGPDPVTNSRTIIRNGIANLSAQDALHASRPGTGTVDQGPNLQPIQTAPAAADVPGAITPVSGAVPVGQPTPAAIGQTEPGPVTAAGAPTVTTHGANLARMGIDLKTGQPPANPAFANLPPALRNPAAAPQAAPIVTGLGPAAAAAQTETGGTSGKDFAAISNEAVASRGRSGVLSNMLADTSQFTSGPLSGIKEKVRGLANQLGVPVDTEKLSASESFNKLAAQLASQQANAGSDARLNVAQAANPHAELSPQGVDLMLRQLQGNEDYLQARAQLGAAWPNKQDKQGFEAQVGKTLNPQTFQYNRMTPDQKRTWFNALPDKDRKQFKIDFGHAQTMPGVLPGG